MQLNPRDLVVPFKPTQARAIIGVNELKHVFAMNPDEVKWSYKSNTISRDTIGGRVVQVLSATTESMTVSGRAGSRRELQVLSLNLKNIMQYQIKTSEPVNFKVPSRNWHFLVYIQNVSNLGWDVTTTSYPYQLTLMVKDDLTGVSEKIINDSIFERLNKGIGYNPEYHGGNLQEAQQYVEAVTNAFNAINYSADSGPASSGFGDEGGPVGDTPGCASKNPNISKITPSCQKFVTEVLNKPKKDGGFADIKRADGVFCCKKTAGTNIWSDHSWGGAVDVGYATSPDTRKLEFAKFAVQNSTKYNIKYVIYNRRIWTNEKSWHSYDGVDPHTSHVHVSFNDSGAADGVVPPCA